MGTTLKGLLFIASIDKALLDFSDEFASQFGGYTGHPIGDKIYSLGEKGLSETNRITQKYVPKKMKEIEMAVKNAIMRMR